LLALLLLVSVGLAQEEDKAPFEYRKQQSGYFGPEGEEPEPSEVKEVLIAWFGPSDPDDPEYGDLWTALRLARDEINAEGGFRGIPIRVISVWTADPWKGGISDMVKVFYRQQPWAMIGSVDSASTHLLEQISAKIRVPVLNPVNTDKSANLANVPWLFSMLPGDHILARILVKGIKSRTDAKDPLVLISGTDHDSRLFSREVRTSLAEEQLVPAFVFDYLPDVPLPWERISSDTSRFLVIAPPAESADLIREIRARNFRGMVFGGPLMGRSLFRELLQADPGGIIYVSPGECSPDTRFAARFRSLTGRNPDYAAASAYDSIFLLRDALLRSGLNRVRLLDEIRELSPWDGISGRIEWDPLGQNARKGRIVAISPE